MGKLLKRRIGSTFQLPEELAARVNRVSDLVTDTTSIPVDGSGAPTDAGYNDKYLGANEFARAYHQNIVEYSDIVNDTTTGGANVPASAESVKQLQLKIDSMANGLEYVGTFDASAGTWPSNVEQGNFFKISVAGIIDSVDLNVGDMMFANKTVSGTTTVDDWDIIDNTEAPDIIRDADVIDNADMTISPLKIPTREAVGDAITTAVAAVTIKVKVETATVSGNTFTLSYSPVSNAVFMDEAIIEIDASNGVYDTWEGVTVSTATNGTVTATLSGANTTDYDGKAAKVTYLYI